MGMRARAITRLLAGAGFLVSAALQQRCNTSAPLLLGVAAATAYA
jgi:hypothetical protein